MLGQVRAAGAAQRLLVILILFVVLLVAIPRQECSSTSDAGEAHDESPPRVRTVGASREDIVLGTIHAIYFSTEQCIVLPLFLEAAQGQCGARRGRYRALEYE